MKLHKIFCSLTAVGLLAVAGTAQAATCEVDNAATNPDASLTNSVACGSGTAKNDTAVEVRAAENLVGYNLDWLALDRDGGLGANADGPLNGWLEGNFSLTTSDGKTGSWSITNPIGSPFSNFLIVLKDGTVKDAGTQWFWFIVDTSVGGCNVAGNTCSGTWTMYGSDGTIKQLSHMSLYGAGPGAGDDDDFDVPEPGSLALLGLGLLGLGVSRRRKA